MTEIARPVEDSARIAQRERIGELGQQLARRQSEHGRALIE
jgi:hypothetical protein